MSAALTKTPEEWAKEAKPLYQKLRAEADKFRDRARTFSKITIPALLPDDSSDTSSDSMSWGYSSEGAIGVNHLSNVYISRMFPPNRSFFKLDPTPQGKEELGKARDEGTLVRGLAMIERNAMKHISDIKARPVLLETLQHLIVSGNILLHKIKQGPLMLYTIDNFVVRRDQTGEIMTMITKDTTYLMALEESVRNQIILEMQIKEDEITAKTVDIYNYIERIAQDQYIHVVVAETIFTGETGTYKKDNLRWEPLVWKRYRKENYGRSLVEEVYNALYTHDVCTEVYLKAAAISADIKFFVDRTAGIDIEKVNKSESGSYHYKNSSQGNAIEAAQVNKVTDLQLSFNMIEKLERTLGQVFLRMASVIRDAERVTADENRMLAQELDQAHGGVFSMLGSTLQRRLAEWTLEDIGASIADGQTVDMIITTGIDALGRNAEAEQLVLFMNDTAILNNVPEDVRARLKMSNFLTRLGVGRDIPIDEVILTEEEYQQQLQMQQQQQMQAAQMQQAGMPQAVPGQPGPQL